MSTEFKVLSGTGKKGVDLHFTSSWGGDEKGVMLQITQGITGTEDPNDRPGFIQLSLIDLYRTVIVLLEWIEHMIHQEEEGNT